MHKSLRLISSIIPFLKMWFIGQYKIGNRLKAHLTLHGGEDSQFTFEELSQHLGHSLEEIRSQVKDLKESANSKIKSIEYASAMQISESDFVWITSYAFFNQVPHWKEALQTFALFDLVVQELARMPEGVNIQLPLIENDLKKYSRQAGFKYIWGFLVAEKYVHQMRILGNEPTIFVINSGRDLPSFPSYIAHISTLRW